MASFDCAADSVQPILPNAGPATRMSHRQSDQLSIRLNFKQDLEGKSPQQPSSKIARTGVIFGSRKTLWSRIDSLQELRERFEEFHSQADAPRLIPIESRCGVSFRLTRQFERHR